MYLDSLVANSAALADSDYGTVIDEEMVDKWSIKPSLAEKLVDILDFVTGKDQITTEAVVDAFGFNPTTAKRYLRQLTEFGYREAHGANKNRSYRKKLFQILRFPSNGKLSGNFILICNLCFNKLYIK